MDPQQKRTPAPNREDHDLDGEEGKTFRPKDEAELSVVPERTALLVIDPVNDFLSEGGAAWEMTKTTVTEKNVIKNLKRLIEGARDRDIPVLFGPMAYTEEDYTEEKLQKRSGINRIMYERKMFLAGSWGADFHPDLQPTEEDIVLEPHKSIDVFETDLPDHLERLGCTHLVIAGMAANLCCESTGRHAMEKGYDVTYISDAIGAESEKAYEAAIHVNYPMVANAVIEVDEFFAAIDSGYADRGSIQEGDVVRGSDHQKIGTVEKVVEGTGEQDGYMLVPRGMIFETDTYIPLESVVKRAGNEIFINLPKMVVGMMPWGEPISLEDFQEKNGPQAGDVTHLYRSRSPSGQGAST